jgi:hypothetical protein
MGRQGFRAWAPHASVIVLTTDIEKRTKWGTLRRGNSIRLFLGGVAFCNFSDSWSMAYGRSSFCWLFFTS